MNRERASKTSIKYEKELRANFDTISENAKCRHYIYRKFNCKI